MKWSALLLTPALAALLLVSSACGGSDAAESTTSGATTTATAESGFPVTVSVGNGDVTIERRPEAVISLSPTATEILFAIGAGEQVIAVDDQSNYPPEAPTSDLSGLTPNIEAIAALEPDLVVVSFDPGDLEASLSGLDIPVIVQFAPADLDGALAQFDQLGAATGNLAGAAGAAGAISARLEELAADLPDFDTPPAYYHELDDTLFSVTSATFAGDIYARLGLENIADPADADGLGYPQLSAEFIVAANPDLIFLADTVCCGQTAESVGDRPGWSEIAAVQNGSVIELDDDVASRWGPRVTEFMEQVAAAISQLVPSP